MNRKMRRLWEKNIKSTIGEQRKANKELNALEESTGYSMMVSFCPDHGPYTANNLCPCYDKGGSYEGVDYDSIQIPQAGENTININICPIHGDYTEDALCLCYNSDGDLKEDWDKDLPRNKYELREESEE